MECSSPLIIGLDIQKYGSTNNTRKQNFFEFKGPKDNNKRKFFTYIGDDANGDERIWLDIAPHRRSCIKSLISNTNKRPEINLVKKVHRFAHGNKKEISHLFTEASMMTYKLEKNIDKVTSSCIPFASSGRPTKTKKHSLKHVNKEFNTGVQADLLTVKTQEGKYEVLNIVDTSTVFGERSVVQARCANVMMSNFEDSWPFRHGPPEHFSADPEFC